MAWLTAREWLALAMDNGINIVDAQTTNDGLALVVKDAGQPSVTFFLSFDYGELYIAAVRVGSQYFAAVNHQRKLEFETMLSRAVGYSRS